MAIRVLLADDHALVRQGFRRILEDEQDIEVVGEAGGGAEAIARGREDSALPGLDDRAQQLIVAFDGSVHRLRVGLP